jgi:hypothetical protein
VFVLTRRTVINPSCSFRHAVPEAGNVRLHFAKIVGYDTVLGVGGTNLRNFYTAILMTTAMKTSSLIYSVFIKGNKIIEFQGPHDL